MYVEFLCSLFFCSLSFRHLQILLSTCSTRAMNWIAKMDQIKEMKKKKKKVLHFETDDKEMLLNIEIVHWSRISIWRKLASGESVNGRYEVRNDQISFFLFLFFFFIFWRKNFVLCQRSLIYLWPFFSLCFCVGKSLQR